jgi:hypothetical protein
MPENEPESKAHEADCSTNSCESFAWFDRASSCWKTSQRCLDGEWATYSESFPRAGTMRSGIAFRRPPSAPITVGIGSSSSELWPTPTTSECGLRIDRIVDASGNPPRHPNQRLYDKVTGRLVSDTLGQAVRMWPTPKAGRPDQDSQFAGDNPTLARAVRLWPTPTKEDSRGGVSTTPGGARSSGLNATVGGHLNPPWVEWLMGFPLGWTGLSASETP